MNITPRDNPGGNVGVKHIVSEVSPNNNQLNCDVDEEVVIRPPLHKGTKCDMRFKSSLNSARLNLLNPYK